MSAEIVIVGTGPGPLHYLTREAERILLDVDKIFFRTGSDPVRQWLKEKGKQTICFDFIYRLPDIKYPQVYQFIANVLLKETRLRGWAVYALPGNPCVFETSTSLIRRDATNAGVSIRIVPGMSFLEIVYVELGIDPGAGLQILDFRDLNPTRSVFTNERPLLVAQIGIPTDPGGESKLEMITRWLSHKYPAEHIVTLIWNTGIPDYTTRTKDFELKDLVAHYSDEKPYCASLYVGPVRPRRPHGSSTTT